MTPLLRTLVIIAVLVAATTGTPPPGYVKQPDNDKNPPSYRYRYRVEDDKTGEAQGKTEVREGEHAAGRYYVNTKRASQDVKYYADEWGYHPVVKYGSADGHSSASASFAIGEHAVESLDKQQAASSESSSSENGQEFVRYVVSYRPVSQSPEENDSSDRSNEQSSLGVVESSTIGSISEKYEQSEEISSTGTAAPIQYYYATMGEELGQGDASHQSTLGNDLGVDGEDQLVVDNAGSFGQRVLGSDDASPSTTPTSSPTRYFQYATLRGKNAETRTIGESGVVYSSSPNSIESEGAQGQENNALSEAYSATTPNSLVVKYDEIFAKKKQTGFAKPIVVADEQQQQPFQYSTTFECEDDEAHTANPVKEEPKRSSDTASTRVLSSIRAGVALVDENDKDTKPVFEEVIEEQPQPKITRAHVALAKDVITDKYLGPKGLNLAGQTSNAIDSSRREEKKIEVYESQRKTSDNVEAVKSIEVYHSLPVQEIHFQQQSSLLEAENRNSLLKGQSVVSLESERQRIETQQEANDRLSKGHANYNYLSREQQREDKKEIRPVYVIPPTTFIVKDDLKELLKNSAPVYPTHYNKDNSPLIKSEDFVAHSVSKQKHSSNGISYETQVNHAQKLDAYPSNNLYYALEAKLPHAIEKIPIPQPYQSIPAPQEKVVVELALPPRPYPDKKVPVPHAYPVPKFVEKPSASHAPYGVRYGASYQQIMKPQKHGLYGHLPQHYPAAPKFNNRHGQFNYSQPFPAVPYDKAPGGPYGDATKAYLPNALLLNRRQRRPDDYVGPVPPMRHVQRQFGFQSKASFGPHPVIGARKPRTHEQPRAFHKGNFRQSKIEYGFKPPMVPSVQYDEETASKVDN